MTTRYYYDDASGADDGTSEANAYEDFADAFSNLAAGDTLYLKRSSSRVTSMGTINVEMPDNDETKMTIIEGYTSSPGDNGQWQGDVKLKIDESGTNEGGNFVIKNLDLERSDADYVLKHDSSQGHSHYINCRIKNTKTDGTNDMAVRAYHTATWTNCLFESDCPTTTVGTVWVASWDSGAFYNCTFRGVRGLVFAHTGAANVNVQNCIFTGSSSGETLTHAIQTDFQSSQTEARGFYVSGCNFYKFDTEAITMADISDLSGSNYQNDMIIINNIFYGDSAASVLNITDTSQTVGPVLINNAFGGITEVVIGEGTNFPNLDSVTLTADPFVDGENLDFRLNDVAGGGALCKGTAYPTTMQGITGASERHIGVIQNTRESISVF